MVGKYSKIFFVIFLLISILVLIFAIWGAPAIISRQIKRSVQIEKGSLMFDNWRKLPIPLQFGVYIFNVTNPDEVNEGGKPKLQEIGPYVYKQYREKTILSYGANDTVRYMLKKTFVFDQEKSGALTEDDQVVVINFSYLAAILTVNDMMPSFVGMVNGALEQLFGNLTDAFLRVRIKDLFFDGIYLNCTGEHSALALVCGQIKAQTPPTMRLAPDDSGFYFSMFSHMNLTESGPYDMVRGTENIGELGHIVAYKNKSVMDQWGDKYCGMLNGSDSSIFPPMVDNVPEKLYSFEPDICRSMFASLVGPSSVFNISAYYYEISESALAAKSANKDNKCFCKKNWSGNHDGCLVMGLLNLAPCQGAPAIASLPHFYLASEELLEYFGEGIMPDKEKHNTYVYLDSVTGVVLKGVRRLQFNIELRSLPAAPQLAKVSTGLFPLLWVEEGAEIPEDIKEDLRSAHRLIQRVHLAPWVTLGISLFCMVLSAIALSRSGALPICARATNSVSFILRPTEANKQY